MPLDPFTALGVAGNIVQFIEFGSKICKAGSELHSSATGSLAETERRKLLTDDLFAISLELESSSSNQIGQSKAEESLRLLAASCKDEANRMLQTLGSLNTTTKHSRWTSAKKATLSVWKEKEIRELERKLSDFRQELSLRLTAALSDQQSTMLGMLKELNQYHAKFQVGVGEDIEAFRNDLIKSLRASSSRSVGFQDLSRLSKDISLLQEEINAQSRIRMILDSLRFESMTARYLGIQSAHQHTFEWVFEDVHPSAGIKVPFKQWLLTGNEIFWINGKPGCGKSTLMKYIINQAALYDLLRSWAGSAPLITASFYFWYSGTELQKSQEGLLRSLLFELLRKCPKAIPLVVPLRWQSSYLPDVAGSWSREELLECIASITEVHVKDSKFCFFIDGLDEFKGEHSDLVTVLCKLSTISNVKMCVASRSWNVFKKAFLDTHTGESSTNSILLHHFIKSDMRLFVEGELSRGLEDLSISRQDARYKGLVEQIVNLSQGVFLWVTLAVRSLKRGLNNSDTISTLQQRIDEFPPDLEHYFERILDSIDPIYQAQTAKMLLTAVSADRPIHILLYRFFDQETLDNALHSPSCTMTLKETEYLMNEIRTLINAQYQDLLEFSHPGLNTIHFFNIVALAGSISEKEGNISPDLGQDESESTDQNRSSTKQAYDSPEIQSRVSSQHVYVQFIHRTVRDFLTTRTTNEFLVNRLHAPFEPAEFLFNAMFAQLKNMPLVDDSRVNFWLLADLDRFIFAYAMGIEKNSKGAFQDFDILDEAENLISMHVTNAKLEDHDQHTLLKRAPYLLRSLFQNFLSYARHLISKDPTLIKELSKQAHLPILLYMVCFYSSSEYVKKTTQISNIDVRARSSVVLRYQTNIPLSTMKLLLEFGAEPNERWDGSTVWTIFLQALFSDRRALAKPVPITRQLRRELLEVTQLMLNAGATSNLRIAVRMSDKERELVAHRTVAEIIEEVFGPDEASHVLAKIKGRSPWNILSYFGNR